MPGHSRCVLEERQAERTRRHQELNAVKSPSQSTLGEAQGIPAPCLAEAGVPIRTVGIRMLWHAKESLRLLPRWGDWSHAVL